MFRLKIREVAEAHGFLTPGHLARESRVSYGTVHKIWNEPDKAQNGLTLGVLSRLSQAIGVRVSELVEDGSPGQHVALTQPA